MNNNYYNTSVQQRNMPKKYDWDKVGGYLSKASD